MNMTSKPHILAVLAVLVALSTVAIRRPAPVEANNLETGGAITAELIGQVANPAPNRTLAYGYLSFIKGLAPDALAGGGELNERTARFTFFVDTVNQRVINNGPLRVIDRAGTMGIYLDTSPDGNWSRPETFQDGEQIAAAELRYQVVIDTLTGAFTARWDLTNAWSKSFTMNGADYRLGRGREQYSITFFGHLNPQAPPAAHIAGFMSGLELQK